MTGPAEEIAFLTRLGSALSVAGDPVSATQRTLRRVAQSKGLTDLQIGVLPTLVFVRGYDGQAPTVDLAAMGGGHGLRLDQIGALDEIVKQAQLGQLSARDGLARLAEMWSMPPRFGAPLRILGQAILAIGLGLVITPRPTALAYCAVLGLLVGVLIELGRRWGTLEVLSPVLGSLLVSVIVFEATTAGQVVAPLLLLIPPLITFLPGGVLTTAMLELADHHPISGASRLVAGATQVLLLVFGIVLGQALVGLPPELAFARRSDNLIGWWAAWVGPLVFTVGAYFHHVAPRRSLGWLMLVVYVAAAAQALGSTLVGGYLGGFLGGLCVALVSFVLERVPGAPPFQVLFLPAFWLLVPGVLAVVGVAELVGNAPTSALLDLGGVTFTILAIALGVLVGVALTRPLRT